MSTGKDNTPPIIVVGGGIMGAAAAYALARRGEKALLVDRWAPGHTHGSSHGDGRIIRYTYPEAVYVAMARMAFEGWAVLEAENGDTLIEQTGSWECGPMGSQVLGELEASLERDGISFEKLDAQASRERFPYFDLPPGSLALYQPAGGVVRASRALDVFWRMASARGAEVRTSVQVVAIEPDDEGVWVRTASGGRWRGRAVILAAGAWSGTLASTLDLDLPLHVTSEEVSHFRPRPGDDLDWGVGGMPTVIDYHDPENPFYVLPQLEVPGIKIGWHHSGDAVDPEDPGTGDDRILRRIQEYVGQRFPRLDPEPVHRIRCLYTNTPDYHFVIDHHPRWPRVVIGAGFSGHGFKFAPVIGEILARLALEEPPPVSLEAFSMQRFKNGSLHRRIAG